MKSQIEYAIMKPGEEDQITDVVISTFDEFVAPQYSDEGVAEFHNHANADALAVRSLQNHFSITGKGFWQESLHGLKKHRSRILTGCRSEH